MTSFHDDFQYRVNYAAKCIMTGTKSRRSNSCYEMWDGDIVVVALVRRARNNPKLWQAIVKDWGQTFPQHWLDLETKHRDTATRDLKILAKKIREAEQIESVKRVAEWTRMAEQETSA